MNQRIILESLAMDLLRTALGLYRGSKKMSDRFRLESFRRQQELEQLNIQDAYTRKLLVDVKMVLNSKKNNIAEDLLMYSILFQNLALKKY